ncbi:hypothetical protein [Limnobacter sp. 130]|uniref:hypothetical protein n=1 Tax=Limnobacter sp. 130 TaxID=2653147 RepID=UPI00135C1DAD|nr:hypothetical protein [Limnobacter sp. 130]
MNFSMKNLPTWLKNPSFIWMLWTKRATPQQMVESCWGKLQKNCGNWVARNSEFHAALRTGTANRTMLN